MKTLLVVTNHDDLTARLQTEGAGCDWSVRASRDCTGTMRGIYNWDPDAIVLDLRSQAGAGCWQIYERIREVSDVPVLVLAGDPAAAVTALKRGADDVVARNGLPAEIMMRSRHLAQTYEQADAGADRQQCFGSLVFDTELRRISNQQREVELTPAEAQLLGRFMQEPDRYLTPQELAATLWQEPEADHGKAIKVYIHRLRRKLKACDPHTGYITNYRSVGYRFRA